MVGYSLGGLIALKYAVVYPDRCPGLVLCSTAPSYSRIPESKWPPNYFPTGCIAQPMAAYTRSHFGQAGRERGAEDA